ncbi:MAG: hypothetical protein WC917_02645 [Bacilli bacterium]|jgi:hypothetical protein
MEYLIKYKIGTDWHNPYNTTTYNYYTEVEEAKTAKIAVNKLLSHYNFSNPNKSIEILSVKKI